MVGGQIGSIDEEAFYSLYQATSPRLFAYLVHVSGRPDVAADVLQDTYCRFLTRKTRATMDVSQTRSYLFRIAANLLHDRGRNKIDEIVQEVPECGFMPNMDQRLDVRSAMRKLKPREREMLWLAYVEGMSHAEIAITMGLSLLSIRILLFRARKKTAGFLKPKRTMGESNAM